MISYIRKLNFILLAILYVFTGCLNRINYKEEINLIFNENVSEDEARTMMIKYNITDYSLNRVKVQNDIGTFNLIKIHINSEIVENIEEFCKKIRNEKIAAYCDINYAEGVLTQYSGIINSTTIYYTTYFYDKNVIS